MSPQVLLLPVVYDFDEPCPYLAERLARLPLRRPSRKLDGAEFDAQLRLGDRRSGSYLYRTDCSGCCSCEAIRIEVAHFQPRRSQRRVLQRGDSRLSLEFGAAQVDAERLRLFNIHRRVRGLAAHEGDVSREMYEAFLAETCCETFEIRYRLSGRLVAVAVCDLGAESLSAVYCYFDPQLSRLSLGSYSIMKQIELCRAWGRRYLYLGYYIAESRHMSYKANYEPHERLIGGRWRRFPNADA